MSSLLYQPTDKSFCVESFLEVVLPEAFEFLLAGCWIGFDDYILELDSRMRSFRSSVFWLQENMEVFEGSLSKPKDWN